MILTRANDNPIPESLYQALRFSQPKFSYGSPHLNIAKPSDPINLQGLLNVMKSIDDRKSGVSNLPTT